MGDSRRFEVFAKLIEKEFPDRNLRICDIAGGKGYLQGALRQLGYNNVITFDKRKGRKDRPKMRYQYRYFNGLVKEEFDLLLGMHPDGATDIIIDQANKRRIPFAIVPCCIMPTVFPFWKKHQYGGWLEHLLELSRKLNFKTEERALKISGRNDCIIGKL